MDRESAQLSEAPSSAFAPARRVHDGKVVQGKDGWLFLAGDTNDVMAQHTGARILDGDALERWAALLERRTRELNARGIEYLFAVAPDNHALYPDKLPDGIRHVGRRPVTQLCEHLAARGSSVRPIYPVAELAAARAEAEVGIPVDTHWSQFGAFVAYRRIADEIERVVPIRRLQLDDLVFSGRWTDGDLGYKLNVAPVEVLEAFIPRRSARLVRDNRVHNSGSLVSTECPEAPGSCVLMSDSYGWGLLKYLAESFGRLTYAYTASLDMELIDAAQPDIVLNVMAERFLVQVPDDDGPSLAMLAIQKWASEAKRARVRFFDEPRVPSMSAVDPVLAGLRASGGGAEATIVGLLAYAGLRQGEVRRLRWRDIRSGSLVIPNALGPPRERTVPLPAEVASDLERWRDSQGGRARPNALVFPGADGGAWARGEWAEWWTRTILPLARRNGPRGLNKAWSLRHFFGALLIRSGAGTREVAERMGLEEVEVLRLYGPWLAGTKPLPPA